MIKLTFSVETINQILTLLGRLPFAEVNNIIRTIVEEANNQIETQEKSEEK